jgi:hypothetical protein
MVFGCARRTSTGAEGGVCFGLRVWTMALAGDIVQTPVYV